MNVFNFKVNTYRLVKKIIPLKKIKLNSIVGCCYQGHKHEDNNNLQTKLFKLLLHVIDPINIDILRNMLYIHISAWWEFRKSTFDAISSS